MGLDTYKMSYICSSRDAAFWPTRVCDHASGNLRADAGHTGRSADDLASPGFQNPLFYYCKNKDSAKITGLGTNIETIKKDNLMYPLFFEAKSAVLSTFRGPAEEDASGKIKEKRPQQQKPVLPAHAFTE